MRQWLANGVSQNAFGRRCAVSLRQNRPQRHYRLSVKAKKQNDGQKETAPVQSWQSLAPEEQEGNPYGNPYAGNQQYYHQYQPYSPPPPTQSGPPYAWIAFGAVAALVGSKMMKQAMKSAGSQGGLPGLGNSGGFPSAGGPGTGFPSGFPAGFPSTTPTKSDSNVYDTQAKDVTSNPAASTPSSSVKSSAEANSPGAKFQEMKAASEGRRRRRDKSSFTDVDQEEKPSTSTASSASPFPPPPIIPDQIRPPNTGDTSSSQTSTTGNGASVDMLETFLQDPQMQELLYQYLPENMRNKETFEWMLKNPEYRAQLEQMLQQQGANLNPDVYKQMQGINSQEVTDQLAQFGMTPADVVQRIMGDPELAQAFSKPKVQQAVMELQNDSMAIMKYQNDPDVMMVFEKMSQLFPDIKP